MRNRVIINILIPLLIILIILTVPSIAATPTGPYFNDQPNVTKEIFLSAGESSAAGTSFYDHATVHLPDAAATLVAFTMKVPLDFVSFTKVEAVWVCELAAAGNMYWTFRGLYSASGENIDTHADTPAYGVTATSGVKDTMVQESANPLTLTSLALGDYLGVELTRDGTHVDDTLGQNANLLGILFTYTGSQFKD